MNLKKSMLAAAVAGVLAMGVAGQAAATEYARSRLFISELGIAITDNGNPLTPGGATVNSLEFNLINTAFLNEVGSASTKSCSGTPSSNNCGGSPVLNATVVNAAGSTILQGENTFTFHGPGLGSYSNSDSVIENAQLVNGVPTSTKQIAESEIQIGDESASASSEVSSTTGFTFRFTVDGENQLYIQFKALLDILAKIDDPTAATASAKANTEVELKLSKDGATNVFAVFSPDGNTSAGECGALGGLSCTTISDLFDLNTDVAVTSVPSSQDGRSNTVANNTFAAVIGGLTNGDWTLGLTAKTSTSLSRTAIPEPATLALLGVGLLGIGAAKRRNGKRV